MTAGEHTQVRPGSGEMFDRIAGRYDMLNRIMSLGIDQRWRRATVQALALHPESRVLDVATGTGDLAIMVAMHHRDAHVCAIDPSKKMLDIGTQKVANAGLSERVSFEVADVQSLPFDDASFDASCVAFGIRNVPDRRLGLTEMARVTRPGGRIAILELNEPNEGWLGPLARFHIRKIVPRVGALLSGSREYRYLQESIAAFPSPSEFAELVGNVGLDVIEVRPLTFGACSLFVAERRGR